MLMIILICLLMVNVLCWIIRLGICLPYINCNQPQKSDGDPFSGIRLIVLIPVLNEQKRIHSCIENCRKIAEAVETGSLTVIFAASCSEHKYPGIFNTIDIIQDYQKQYSWIKMYQCPVPGVMAHQLNYAIQQFKLENSIPTNTLYALYNVDSILSLSALSWVCNQYRSAKSIQIIYQQYGCYTKNWNEVAEQPWYIRGILRANMLWQTRWSIGFEIPHALIGRGLGKSGRIWMLNYCIGHGLFYSDEVYRIIGGFEEDTLNEDAIFGLKACLYNIPIIPVPELEIADSPDLVSSLFRQKTTWIYGPAQAFTYYRLIIKRDLAILPYDRIRLLVLCLQLFEHSLRWVSVPAIVLGGIILCFRESPLLVVAYITVLMVYLGGLDLFCTETVPNIRHYSAFDMLTILYGAFIQFELHGISGMIGFYKLIRARLTNGPIAKGKTEMKQ